MEVGEGKDLEHDLIHRNADHVTDKAEQVVDGMAYCSFKVVEKKREYKWSKVDHDLNIALPMTFGEQLVICSTNKKKIK